MNELAWQRRENRLIEAHIAADPPLSPALWRGVEAGLAAQPRPPRRAMWLALGAVVVAAAGVVVWFRPGDTAWQPVRAPAAAVAPPVLAPAPPEPQPDLGPPPAPPPALVLNQVLETTGPVTVAISAGAGRLEIEPCRGRFVNVTVLDSRHRRLALVERGRRVEVELDGGSILDSGVAHVLVPADTHLILSTRTGAIVVRGLGGPLEIDSGSGSVEIDTAPRLDPQVNVVTESGAIQWRGRCGGACRVEARSHSGDITLRAPDPAAFTRGAARAASVAGRVQLEDLTCTEPRCASPPLPWRQPAAGQASPPH